MCLIRPTTALFLCALLIGCGDDGGSAPDAAPSTIDAGPDQADAALADAEVPDAEPPALFTKAYLFGDFATNNLIEVAFYDGESNDLTQLSLANLDGTDINAIAISPDGTQLAASGHSAAESSDFIYLYDLDDLGSPTTLLSTANVGHTVDIVNLQFSPDGSSLAFTADIATNNADGLHVVAVDGQSPAKRVSQTPPSGGDVKTFVWGADSTTLFYLGDVEQDNVGSAWSVDSSAGTPTPLALVPTQQLSAGADVHGLQLEIASDGKLYFLSRHTADTQRLFRVDPDGQNLEQVPGTVVMTNGSTESDIQSWSLSPSGDTLAFAAAPEVGVEQLHLLDVGETSSTQLTTVPAVVGPLLGQVFGPTPQVPYAWSSDESTLAFAADWPVEVTDADDQRGLWRVNRSDGIAKRLAQSASAELSLIQAFMGPDPERLLFRGDALSDGENDLFSTSDLDTVGQSLEALRITTSPEGGDVEAVVIAP